MSFIIFRIEGSAGLTLNGVEYQEIIAEPEIEVEGSEELPPDPAPDDEELPL